MDDGDFVGDSEDEFDSAPSVHAISVAAPLVGGGESSASADRLAAVSVSHSETPETSATGEDEREPLEAAGGADIPGPAAVEDVSERKSVDGVVEDANVSKPETFVVELDEAATRGTESAPSERDAERGSADAGPRAKFKVGDIVHVASRTWPGINKLGGAGKIVSIVTETDDSGGPVFLYSVKYMLGGFEKRIEEEFIQDLADALESGVRQHKERVFYHDEFAHDSHKRHIPVHLENNQGQQPRAAGIVTAGEKVAEDVPKRVKKRGKTHEVDQPELEDAPDIEYRERSSDDSDYGEDPEDSARDAATLIRRKLDEDSFIMDQRQGETNAPKQRKRERGSSPNRGEFRKERRSKVERRDVEEHQNPTPRARTKRTNRIVDSDDESEIEEDNVFARSKKRRTLKRPHYIGGYEHGAQDADGSFIQPEGNPTELPEDVAKELKLKLGSTKAQLREQLNSVADNLLNNLAAFDKKKKELRRRLEFLNSLDETGLQGANREVLELGEFVRTKFIRSGEDVMNLIIKMLEKKGASLPDRIDLQYEEWKERVAENDAWVKQNIRALETAFTRRGLSDLFLERLSIEESSSESSSSEATEDNSRSDGEGHEMFYNDVVSPSSRWRDWGRDASNESEVKQQSERQGSRRSSQTNSRPASKKRPRTLRSMQSSIDNFTIPLDKFASEENSRLTRGLSTSGFRYIRRRGEELPMDPRWDWARKIKRSTPTIPRVPPQDRGGNSNSMGKLYSVTKRAKGRGSESVMEAVLRLRDQRFRERYKTRTSSPPVQVAHSSVLTNFPISGNPSVAISSLRSHDYSVRRIKSPVSAEHGRDDNEIQTPRKWGRLFGVFTSEEILPVYRKLEIVPVGRHVPAVDSAREGDLIWDSDDRDFNQHYVTRVALALRQKLNAIRWAEEEAMDRVLSERLLPSGEDCFATKSFWLSLTALAENFKLELERFVDSLIEASCGIHDAHVKPFLESAVSELATILKQVPDSNATYNGSPSYAYFFEVASPGSRSTPMISSFCSVYWYSILVLVRLKEASESLWSKSKELDVIFVEKLPPNRVALACCLFLIDLYINVPSTHRLDGDNASPDEASEVDAPALSLWVLLHNMFAEGTLQSSKNSELSNSLWNFLQTTHQQRFIDALGVSFIKRESIGGYMKERAPSAIPDSDEGIQGKLLAADVLWDLCASLTVFVRASKSSPSTSSIWSLVKYLTQGDLPSVLQLGTLSEIEVADDEFQLQTHGFRLRILRRLLALSAIWSPDSSVMEDMLPKLWSLVPEEQDSTALYSIVDYISEIRNLVHRGDIPTLYNFARQHASETTDSVVLFCKITVMQLSKLEKSIHRNRYRQPLLRAITSRVDVHKAAQDAVSRRVGDSNSADSTAGNKVSTTTWNWIKAGSRAPSAASQPSQPGNSILPSTQQIATTPNHAVAEVNAILSILLMFGLSSIYLDDEPPQSTRRQKELKREIEYFCKELTSSSCHFPELSVHLCHCLTVIGSAAVDVRISYSVVFDHISGLMGWISDAISQKGQVDSPYDESQQFQSASLAAGATACLQSIRDMSLHLVSQLKERRSIDLHEFEQLKMCVTSVLGGALPSVFEASIDGVIPHRNLDIAIEILIIWLPNFCPTPTKSLIVLPSSNHTQGEDVDEFDDPEMLDLLASVDIDHPSTAIENPERCFRSVQEIALDVAIDSLRLSLQKVLLSLRRKRWRSFEELYLIDILGAMISSCKFPFSWNSVSLSSLKPRMLAPRLLASVLHRRGEKDWFSTCYLSEHNADVELSELWLTSTLDLRSLFPTVCAATIQMRANGSDVGPIHSAALSAKYSSYWLLLTDGILASVLKEDPVVRYKMDQLMFELLQGAARKCSFGDYIRRNSDPSDVSTLYAMHVDIFRAFCSSAGQLWRTISVDPVQHRQEMNRLRFKMMDAHRGVFVALPEAYEINLKAVCMELDRKNINWYDLSSRFLDEFKPALGAGSLHLFDDATNTLDRELIDTSIRPLIVLYKFMYDCVDSFLFNCGGMAIGQQNIFYSIIELMFRQARCAEYPVAERRLRHSSVNVVHPPVAATMKPTTGAAAMAMTEISPACAGFVESVRLFFAYQKYPSLINWFAQNVETYQTLKAGWIASPLRVLLYNVFDPHGPLGIHSYYPIQDDLTMGFDPKAIRREAFYLACGVLHCRCTKSYEHTRCPQEHDQEDRRSQLRRFILCDFAHELEATAAREGENLAESLLPFFQFVKAVMNHLTLDGCANLQPDSRSSSAFDVDSDLMPCLSSVVRIVGLILREDSQMSETMSCVIMIEFCCILEDLLRINALLQDARVAQVIDNVLRCAGFAYMAIQKYSSAPAEMLFESTHFQHYSLDRLVEEFVTLPARVRGDTDSKVKVEASPSIGSDDYGISRSRVRADLLSVVHWVVKSCKQLGGHRFLAGATVSPVTDLASQAPQPLPRHISADGTT